jgi:hypothetical protein
VTNSLTVRVVMAALIGAAGLAAVAGAGGTAYATPEITPVIQPSSGIQAAQV